MEIINYNDKINEIKMEDITFHGWLEGSCLTIHWELLYGCNYKCSYCFGQETLTNTTFFSFNKLKNAVDKIFRIKRNSYYFIIQGGEATYHPDFLKLLEYIYSFKGKKISILLITNGSKNIDYFKKIIDISKNNIFKCLISLHLEYADIEHIKNLIVLFNNNKRKLSVKIMVHPILIEKAKNFFEELILLKNDFQFEISLEELREGPDYSKIDSRYTESYLNWIDDARIKLKKIESDVNTIVENFNDNLKINTAYYKLKGNEDKKIYINPDLAIRHNLREFKGFYCCAGINLLCIRGSGGYTAAFCPQAKIIGNIYEDDNINYLELSEFLKCTSLQCTCFSQDDNPKFRDIELAKEYVSNYRKENSELIIEYMINSIEELKRQINNKSIDNKINKLVDTLAWWIPFKKKREEFRAKFKI